MLTALQDGVHSRLLCAEQSWSLGFNIVILGARAIQRHSNLKKLFQFLRGLCCRSQRRTKYNTNSLCLQKKLLLNRQSGVRWRQIY